ncbi:hypothetical protein OEV98_14325 [Caldibacillus lycopersici]|uniref:Aminopeptidase n=1 Tax=Perspicuibacillus lycopersici TaxID=1325689 RepID=A0AAE3IUF8_9BACI|nr:hypothetical protein [Perspicuibacillus lycopersici]MCU9614716.1 hypothetical protein [Perspicuibacillus lycopersici]
MQITDTIPAFPKEVTIQKLKKYYEQYPEAFNEYFTYHCKATDLDSRLATAIKAYEDSMPSIVKVHKNIANYITEISKLYEDQYQINFPIQVYLIIGAFGSNAYTHRQIIPNITFALEKLSSEEDPLLVLIAHEFGHAAHNIITNQTQFEWKMMQWEHPYTWLLQEGAATHLSRKIIANKEPSIYFSHDLHGEAWLSFAQENSCKIIHQFYQDSNAENRSVYKEWFSITGGSNFGHSRLAYFIGDMLFQDFVQMYGEKGALLLWTKRDFIYLVDEWFKSRM